MKTLAAIPTFTRSIEGLRTKALGVLRQKFTGAKELGHVTNGNLYVLSYDLAEPTNTDEVAKVLMRNMLGANQTEYQRQTDNSAIITVVSYMGMGLISYEETILVRVGLSKLVISIPLFA